MQAWAKIQLLSNLFQHWSELLNLTAGQVQIEDSEARGGPSLTGQGTPKSDTRLHLLRSKSNGATNHGRHKVATLHVGACTHWA